MFSNVFGKKKKERTRPKKRADKSSGETDATQDSGYYTASAIEFPTVEEWIAGKDQFRVVAVGHARPFPMVRQVSSNNDLVNYHRVHVAPHSSPILASHKISFTSIALRRRKSPGTVDQFMEKETDHDLESLVISSTGDDTLRSCRNLRFVRNGRLRTGGHRGGDMQPIADDMEQIACFGH